MPSSPRTRGSRVPNATLRPVWIPACAGTTAKVGLNGHSLSIHSQPLRRVVVLVLVVEDEADGALPDLGRVAGGLAHGSKLSRMGASGKPGSIQSVSWTVFAVCSACIGAGGCGCSARLRAGCRFRCRDAHDGRRRRRGRSLRWCALRRDTYPCQPPQGCCDDRLNPGRTLAAWGVRRYKSST